MPRVCSYSYSSPSHIKELRHSVVGSHAGGCTCSSRVASTGLYSTLHHQDTSRLALNDQERHTSCPALFSLFKLAGHSPPAPSALRARLVQAAAMTNTSSNTNADVHRSADGTPRQIIHMRPMTHTLPAKRQGYTRFVLLSDSHTHTYPVPDGDVLIHAGDLTVCPLVLVLVLASIRITLRVHLRVSNLTRDSRPRRSTEQQKSCRSPSIGCLRCRIRTRS